MSNRKALLGKKLGMSQVWDENGFFVPVTLVDVSTNVVTAVKTEESDGYKAVQLGYGAIDPTKVTKPLAGHFASRCHPASPPRRGAHRRVDQFEAGQELAADLFEEGAEVDVTGTTKGKASPVPSSVGASSPTAVLTVLTRTSAVPVLWAHAPLRAVFSRQAYGRPHGSCDRHYQNLTVVSADVENGILAIKGAIPGPKGGIVLVRSAVKGA